MSTAVVCKSIFVIQHLNKKSIVAAFLKGRLYISVIIQLDSELGKQNVNLILKNGVYYQMIMILTKCLMIHVIRPVIVSTNFSYFTNRKHSSLS